jgi:chaperone modulatory protein CbpM
MIDTREFLIHAHLDTEVLEAWIEAGWLLPQREGDVRRFSEVDLARAQLIRDLREGIGVNEEGVAVILDLIDQIHGLRRTLREVLSAICAEPETTRRRIAANVQGAASSETGSDADWLAGSGDNQ